MLVLLWNTIRKVVYLQTHNEKESLRFLRDHGITWTHSADLISEAATGHWVLWRPVEGYLLHSII